MSRLVCIDDVFSLWNTSLDKIESFAEKANNFHSTTKFTAEMSETEITFLDSKVYKGVRFNKESILDVQTHYKPTETFQHTNLYSRVTNLVPRALFPGFGGRGWRVTHRA